MLNSHASSPIMREWHKRAMTNPKAQAHKVRPTPQGQLDAADLASDPVRLKVKRRLLAQKCGTAAGDVGFMDFKAGLTLYANTRFPLIASIIGISDLGLALGRFGGS